MIRLTVTAKRESRVVESGGQAITIGRGSECTVCIHDEGASRLHCTIEQLADGSFKLSDLKSCNGTRLNGEAITEVPIKLGDVISIGTATIRVDSLTSEAVPAPGQAPQAAQARSQGHDALPKLRLDFVAGPNKGETYLVVHRVTRIGRRRRDSEIALFDTGVSNRHAEIREVPQGFVIADVGSKNGTFLNNQPVQQSPLKPGDRIQIGRSVIEVLPGDSTTATTAHIQRPSPAELPPLPAQAAPPAAQGAEAPTAGAPPPAQGAPQPVPPAAAGPPAVAARGSRRRITVLASAIVLLVLFFVGVVAVRALRSRSRRPPAGQSTADRPTEGGTGQEKGTGGGERPATAPRTADPTKAVPPKAEPSPADPATREKRIKDDVDAALRALRRAELTAEPTGFDDAQKMLDALRASVKGTPHESEVAKALDALPGARQAAHRARDAEPAALLAVAKTHAERKEPSLAVLHCRELLARFPDSPAAADAKALLQTLSPPAAIPKEK